MTDTNANTIDDQVRAGGAVHASSGASSWLTPQANELRVLHVEDDPLDAELVAQALRKGGFSFSVVVVQTEAGFERELRAHPPDVVLADYNLPQWKGMEALEVLRREGLDVPLILVSGALGDVTAVGCIKRGATDYVLKDGLARLPEAICRALREKRLVRLRRQVEEDLARKIEELTATLKDLADQKFALDQHAIVAVTDVQGTITYVNEKFCAISQYSRDELIGQNHRIVSSGYHPKEFFQQMYQTIGGGQVWHGEMRNRAKDGSIYWVDATIVPLLGGDGKPRQYIAIRADITERKRAEEALHESEQRYRLLFREMVVGFALLEVIYDENGRPCDHRYLEVNPAFEMHSGLPRDGVVGKTIREVIPGIEPFWIETYGKVATTGESVHFENYVQALRKWFEVTAFRNHQGQLAVTFADVSERKETEAQLAAQAKELTGKAKELARSNADLEQFAYVASHDLQEPLRMVAAYTQLLAERYRGKLDENADKYIGYASEGALRMQSLIQDLLAFSRVGRNGDACGHVDCEAVMEEVLLTLGPAIQESGAVVTHGALPVVWTDRSQIVQVLQNLVGNAIKFHGNEPPVISVQAEKTGGQWLFSVSDNGIGIPPESVQSIFTVFQRLHTRAEYPGNGIGLAICKKIIEHCGGKIWVESQVGRGSIFKFTIPCDDPAEKELCDEEMAVSRP
jgi:PAS domain S-box-containing protein